MITDISALAFRFGFLILLLAAEFIFVVHLPKKKHFLLRFLCGILLIMLLLFFVPSLEHTPAYSTLFFILIFLLTNVLIKFCYETTWMNCFFRTLAGYSAQHIGSTIHSLVYTLIYGTYMENSFENILNFGADSLQILIPLISYVLIYFLFGRRIADDDEVTIQNIWFFFLTAASVFIEILFSDLIRFENSLSFNRRFYLVDSFTNLICSFTLLIIQFNLLEQRHLKHELEIISQMLYKEQQQYMISKETIDLINMKCHDMRHQIHHIGKSNNIDSSAIQEMEQTINIYDSLIDTENRALNIIFAEKSLYCQKNNITINCIADGKKLNFMSTSDVYSLFGNLLDNAIQSVMKLDNEKRFINLTIRQQAQFLSINSNNYFTGDIVMDNDLPVSSNQDKTIHGFGVKSMRTIVEKYNGTISFEVEDCIFNVNILIPLE